MNDSKYKWIVEKTRKFFLLTIIFLFCLFIGLFWLLQTNFARSKIKELLIQTARQRYNIELRIGAVSGGFFYDLSLQQVQIVSKGVTILHIDQVSCEYFSHMLLARKLFIERLQVEGLRLNAVKNMDGSWNLDQLLGVHAAPNAGGGKKAGIAVVLKRITVLDAGLKFTVSNSETDQQWEWKHVNLVAAFRSDPEPRFILHRSSFSLEPVLDGRLSLKGQVSYNPEPKQLRLDEVAFNSEMSEVSLRGVVDFNRENPHFDATVNINALALKEMRGMLSVNNLPNEVLRGELRFSGQSERLSVVSALQLNRLGLDIQGTLNLPSTDHPSLDLKGNISHLSPSVFIANSRAAMNGDVNAAFDICVNDLFSPEWSGDGALSIASSVLSDFQIDQGSINLEITPKQLTITDGHLMTPFGKAHFQGSMSDIFDRRSDKQLTFDATIRECNPFLFSKRKDVPADINMNIEAMVVIPNSLKSDLIAADIIADVIPSSISEFTIQHGSFRGKWSDNAVLAEELILATELGSFSGQGSVIPAEKRCNMHADIEIVEIQEIVRGIDESFPTLVPQSANFENLVGYVALSADVTGLWNNPHIAFVARGEQFAFGDTTAETVRISGKWQGLSDEFDGAMHIDLKKIGIGTINFSNVQGHLDCNYNDLKVDLSCIHEKDIRTSLSGEISQWREATKTIRIDTFELNFKELALANADPIHLRIARHQLEIASCDLRLNETPIVIFGGLEKGGDKSITLNTDTLDLNSVLSTVLGDLELDGSCVLNAELRGWLDKFMVTTLVQGKELTYGKIGVDTLTLMGTVTHETDSGEIQAESKLTLGNCNIYGEQFPKLIVDAQVDCNNASVAVSAMHHAGNEISFEGLVENWLRPSNITVNELMITVDEAPITNQDSIEISMGDGVLDVAPVTLTSGQTTLSLGGKLGRDNIQGISLAVEDLSLGRLPWSSNEIVAFNGILSGRIDITGSPSSPILDAHVDISNGNVNNFPFSAMATQIRYSDSKVTVDARMDPEEGQVVTLRGMAGFGFSLMPLKFEQKPGLDLLVKAPNLAVSGFPIPEEANLILDGNLELDIHATGQLSRPKLSGLIALNNGALTLERQGLSYETVNCKFVLTPDKIVLEHLTIHGDNEGDMDGRGEVDLDNGKPAAINVQLTGENIFIPYQKTYHAWIQPNLLLTGTLENPRLAGTITVSEARINVDRISKLVPAEIEVIRPADDGREVALQGPDQKVSTFVRRLAADVYITIEKNAWLKGKDMDIELAGKINLKKDREEPFNLLGTLSTVRGTYDFRGKLFKVVNGDITFIGLDEPNPNLDIRAVTRIKRVDIFITIGGSARDMTLAFDSDPDMDQADIISYLVFGQSTDSLKGDRAFNAEKTALSLTGKMAASELKNLIGDLALFDTFTLSSGDGDIRAGSVNLGKYISPKVFLTYHQGFTSEEPSQITVNYEFNEHLSIETQVGNEKTNGIDLIFEYDF